MFISRQSDVNAFCIRSAGRRGMSQLLGLWS
jgi:hypothetical protein